MPHPLDPLTADEIRRAAAIVRHDREAGDGWRFASIELKEPAKADLPALENGRQAGREALVVCWNRADGQAYRATVSLAGSAGKAGEAGEAGEGRAQPPSAASRYPAPRTVRSARRPNGASIFRRRYPT